MPRKPKYKLKSIQLGDETVGQRLTRIRKQRGYTQTQLAQKIGIKQALVSDYERDRFRISAEMIVHLAIALEVSTDKILGLDQSTADDSLVNAAILKKMKLIEQLPPKQKKAIVKSVELVIDGGLAQRQ